LGSGDPEANVQYIHGVDQTAKLLQGYFDKEYNDNMSEINERLEKEYSENMKGFKKLHHRAYLEEEEEGYNGITEDDFQYKGKTVSDFDIVLSCHLALEVARKRHDEIVLLVHRKNFIPGRKVELGADDR